MPEIDEAVEVKTETINGCAVEYWGFDTDCVGPLALVDPAAVRVIVQEAHRGWLAESLTRYRELWAEMANV